MALKFRNFHCVWFLFCFHETLTENISSNYIFVTSIVKTLLSRNFCQKCLRLNHSNFHIECGKPRNSLSLIFYFLFFFALLSRNFWKVAYKKSQSISLWFSWNFCKTMMYLKRSSLHCNLSSRNIVEVKEKWFLHTLVHVTQFGNYGNLLSLLLAKISWK